MSNEIDWKARAEAAESKLAEFYAWVERFQAVVNGDREQDQTIVVLPASQAAKDLHAVATREASK